MSDKYKEGLERLAKERSIYPQESLLKIKKDNKALFIGIPSEISWQEKRVPLTPEAVGILVNNGHEVRIETNAGKGSKFFDNEYSDNGAKIVYSHKEAFEADIILKVEPPTADEIEFLAPQKTLISALQIGEQTSDFINAINSKRVTAIGYELLEDKVGGMPVVRAMSEIAGSTVMLIAAEYLNSVSNGKGIILGGITGVPPTKVVILGAGTVGEYAARTALGLGANIEIYDNQIYRLRRIRHLLSQQVYTSLIDTTTIAESLMSADVLIGAMRAEKGRNKCIVTEEMVANMKSESVIIDVSIDQGGCIETSQATTHKNPVFRKYDVIHYCVPNIASRVAGTATLAFSNFITPMLLSIGDAGDIEDFIFSHKWFMKGVYSYNGSLTNADIARKFNLKSKDLNLLMAARF